MRLFPGIVTIRSDKKHPHPCIFISYRFCYVTDLIKINGLVDQEGWMLKIVIVNNNNNNDKNNSNWHLLSKYCFPSAFLAICMLLSHVWLFGTSRTAACQALLSSIISQSLLQFMFTDSVMLSNHLISHHPHLLLPSIFPSISVFPMSRFFTPAGQSIGASGSASVLPLIIQVWLLLG